MKNELVFSGTRFEGVLVSPENNIVIESDTTFNGDIKSNSIDIRGKVNGNIHTSKVVLRYGCEVNGEINTDSFIVEEGAMGTFKIITKNGS